MNECTQTNAAKQQVSAREVSKAALDVANRTQSVNLRRLSPLCLHGQPGTPWWAECRVRGGSGAFSNGRLNFCATFFVSVRFPSSHSSDAFVGPLEALLDISEALLPERLSLAGVKGSSHWRSGCRAYDEDATQRLQRILKYSECKHLTVSL